MPGLRSLSVAKLVGKRSQVHDTEDILNVATGGQLGDERGGGRSQSARCW